MDGQRGEPHAEEEVRGRIGLRAAALRGQARYTRDIRVGEDSPMALQISRADLTDPQLHAFLNAHLADLAPTAPPESRHALDLSALGAPGVQLWVGHRAGALVATGALSAISADHEELKSMRTDPAVRGEGIASAMLAHLIADARSRGVEQLSLETGSMEFFAPARRLYASAGFVRCEPFGSYSPDPHSVFMTLEL